MEDYINVRISQILEERDKSKDEQTRAFLLSKAHELHLARQYKWRDKYPQQCVLEAQ